MKKKGNGAARDRPRLRHLDGQPPGQVPHGSRQGPVMYRALTPSSFLLSPAADSPPSKPSSQVSAASNHEMSRELDEPRSRGWAGAGTVDRRKARTRATATETRDIERNMGYSLHQSGSPWAAVRETSKRKTKQRFLLSAAGGVKRDKIP